MTSLRRRKARVALFRWVLLTVVTAAAITLPLTGLIPLTQSGGLSRLLTTSNCMALLREGVPLLDQDLAPALSRPAATGRTESRGVLPWLFAVLTGVSVGEPASFLTADLPLARSAYAPAILASGRSVSAGSGPGGATGTTGPSGGLPSHPPRPEAGVPGGGAGEGDDFFRYYGGRDPLLAIVHSHGSESFLSEVEALILDANPKADLSKLDSFTTDTSVNMIRVGEELARYMATVHGIPVVQARNLHDLKDDGFRLGAYSRSLVTMTTVLCEHPRVKVLLDLHRDAPGREITTATINGNPAARILVVVGTDRLLDNPRWEENYRFARRLILAMEEMYPGLSRGIIVRDERYNQHVMERTLLLELGGQENTLDEVFLSVRYLGEVLAHLFAEGFD